MNNTNLCPTVGQIIVFDRGVPRFNSLVRGEPLNLELQNLTSITRNITIVWCAA